MFNRVALAFPYVVALATLSFLIAQAPLQESMPLHKPTLSSPQEVTAGSRTPLGMVVNWARMLRASQRQPESLTWERLMANADGSIVCIAFAVRDEANKPVTRRVAFVSGQGGAQGSEWESNCNGDVAVVADAEKWITAR
jgi:hypothetical protein